MMITVDKYCQHHGAFFVSNLQGLQEDSTYPKQLGFMGDISIDGMISQYWLVVSIPLKNINQLG